MTTILRYTLARFGGQILGWGIALFLLGLLIGQIYDLVQERRQQLEELLQNFPPAVFAFLGDLTQMFTPEGFLSVRFFSLMPLILGIFAVLAGSGLIASDEENGTLDLVLAHPISRTDLFLGRLFAFGAALLGILAGAWLGLVVSMIWSTLAVGWGRLLLPFVALFAVLLLFGTLALLLGLLLPARRQAAMTAGLTVVASYFLTSLARLDSRLEAFAHFSPLNYYQSGEAIRGLNFTWLGGLLAVAGLFTLLAWWRFERRDIRVGGEGVWRWPLRRKGAA